ncbi:MAG TPA: hypothetical protein VMI12_07340 [Puia sp.]|nr:hypothetical protein [Puia sp.]
MKKLSSLTIAFLFLIPACKNGEQKKDTPPPQEEKKDYFPVVDYIKSEIDYVDSLPAAIKKYTIRNGIKDSMFIKAADFDQLAKIFLPAELNNPGFEKDFTETSFFDQTTGLLTFTYATKNKKSLLQRVDVLLTPSAGLSTGFNKVKSVYMEKLENKNDTLSTQKMYWRAKKSFDIISILQPENQSPISDQVKVVWDDSE